MSWLPGVGKGSGEGVERRPFNAIEPAIFLIRNPAQHTASTALSLLLESRVSAQIHGVFNQQHLF
ncbi:MAG: hypothetical protein RQ885_04600 [Desulfurococcales archaeon]|jgi:hypothetical protein|nr:hypothetical protein [Desulfurococcales archaeon]